VHQRLIHDHRHTDGAPVSDNVAAGESVESAVKREQMNDGAGRHPELSGADGLAGTKPGRL